MTFSPSLLLSSLRNTSHIPSKPPIRTVEHICVSAARDVVCESSFFSRKASLWAQGHKLDRPVRTGNYVWKVLERSTTLAMYLSSRRIANLLVLVSAPLKGIRNGYIPTADLNRRNLGKVWSLPAMFQVTKCMYARTGSRRRSKAHVGTMNAMTSL
jgi:hypothetical protein